MGSLDLKNAIVTINKDLMTTLPAEEYKGEIVIIDDLSKVEDAVKELRESSIIGFDTETRPSFKKGQVFKVALIQLCNNEKCYLFRTNLIGYPKELLALLEDPKILKVGLSIHDDFHNLRKINAINPQGFLDLQTFVKEYKIADNSLTRLYSILFGKRISKSQRLTNWEAPTLSESQQNYAALDAYACIRIYKYLIEGNFNPIKSPYLCYPLEPEEPESKEK